MSKRNAQHQDQEREFSDAEIFTDDAAYFLEAVALEASIRELVRYEVKPGDGDLPTKARWVLETGARHIAEGRPTDAFLRFVAYAINTALNSKRPSLDRAFRLKSPAHRPESDPYTDEAIQKGLDLLYQETAQLDGQRLDSKAREKALVAIRRKVIDAAYTVRWKDSPDEHKANGIDPESIKKRRNTLRKTFQRLGNL